ncbi:MAG TPA: SRPBCC family protein, partial [Longimicrobiales bacterium]|nr:SRPBCC family protein [Longimicrobiales bacterium]
GTMTIETVEAEVPTRLVTRIADEDLPFGGTWTYELEPTGDGRTRVTITEDGEVYNPVFRFMARFVFGHTATMDTYLDGLEARMGPGSTGVGEG